MLLLVSTIYEDSPHSMDVPIVLLLGEKCRDHTQNTCASTQQEPWEVTARTMYEPTGHWSRPRFTSASDVTLSHHCFTWSCQQQDRFRVLSGTKDKESPLNTFKTVEAENPTNHKRIQPHLQDIKHKWSFCIFISTSIQILKSTLANMNLSETVNVKGHSYLCSLVLCHFAPWKTSPGQTFTVWGQRENQRWRGTG